MYLTKNNTQLYTNTGQPIQAAITALHLVENMEWLPRVQGRISVLHDPGQQLPGEISLSLLQNYGATITPGQITSAGGSTPGALTALGYTSPAAVTGNLVRPWYVFEQIRPLKDYTQTLGSSIAGLNVVPAKIKDITAKMRRAGGAYDPPKPARKTLLLRAEVAAFNPATGETEYTLNSLDIAALEVIRVETTPLTSTAATLADLVTTWAATVGIAVYPVENADIEPGAAWQPGATLWEALAPYLESTGYTLTPRSGGGLNLEPLTARPASVTLDAETNLISIETAKTKPIDGVIIEYGNAENRKLDIHAAAGARNIKRITRPPRDEHITGAAEQIAERENERANTAIITAVADYRLNPGENVTINTGKKHYQMQITSIALDVFESVQTITGRNLQEL